MDNNLVLKEGLYTGIIDSYDILPGIAILLVYKLDVVNTTIKQGVYPVLTPKSKLYKILTNLGITIKIGQVINFEKIFNTSLKGKHVSLNIGLYTDVNKVIRNYIIDEHLKEDL